MINRIRACIVSLLFSSVYVSPVAAQPLMTGAKVAPAVEIAAILAAIRSVASQERVEISIRRICSVELSHPDCPRTLKETNINGRLPGRIWGLVRLAMMDDESLGKHHSSLGDATFVVVQRPVAVGDSLMMLIEVIRPVAGESAARTFYDCVLRGDSTQMQVVHKLSRASPWVER